MREQSQLPCRNLLRIETFEFIPIYVHDASEARSPRDGWWTMHWPAVALAFLEITDVPADEV